MKKDYSLLKISKWLLSALLCLLGFAGCHKIGTEEYGTPHADYVIKGAVVSKETGNPIPGIRISYYPQTWIDLFGPPPVNYYGPKAHVFTNAKGEFTLSDSYFTFPDYFYAEDVDGELNGSYIPQKIEIDSKNAILSGKPSHWYEGVYTIIQNVALIDWGTAVVMYAPPYAKYCIKNKVIEPKQIDE